MGMKIARPIQTLKYLKDSGVFPFDTKEGMIYTAESIDDAIVAIRKYQEIQEIFKKYDKGELTHNMFGFLVGKVIEDGKNS